MKAKKKRYLLALCASAACAWNGQYKHNETIQDCFNLVSEISTVETERTLIYGSSFLLTVKKMVSSDPAHQI